MAVNNRAGQLRDRVAIQNRTTGFDSFGSESESFTTLDTVWAQVIPLTGTERHAAGQPEATLSHKVVIRYRNDVTPEQQLVVENGPTLDILSVADIDSRKTRLELSCIERRV